MIACALALLGVELAGAGAWLTFGFGVALLVVAVLVLAFALLFGLSSDEQPAPAQLEDPVVEAQAPDVGHVRMRSNIAIVKKAG